jgi:hypothetical protein
MNRNLLKKLVKEILNEATEAELKRLRRAVILSIFNSDIPTTIKRDLNAALSGAPDADVRKVTRVFLNQVLKDEETLTTSPEYQELKQDPEFQKLANNVNQKIKLDNKAGLLDMSNVAFTTSDISKPFSYSTLLYYAVEREAQAVVQYLSKKYGKEFSKALYRMLPRQSTPAVKPTKENLDELDLSAMIQSKYPAEDLDKELGTKLAKKYTYPAGYNEDTIEREITKIQPQNSKFNDESYQEKVDEVYNLLVQMNRPALGGIKADTHQKKWDLIYGVISHFNPDDIKFFVEQWKGGEVPEGRTYFDTVINLEKKFDVPINWIPSPKNLYTIIDAIDKKFIQK